MLFPLVVSMLYMLNIPSRIPIAAPVCPLKREDLGFLRQKIWCGTWIRLVVVTFHIYYFFLHEQKKIQPIVYLSCLRANNKYNLPDFSSYRVAEVSDPETLRSSRRLQLVCGSSLTRATTDFSHDCISY